MTKAKSPFAERNLHPQHGERLKQPRGLELAGIDRLEADIGDQPEHCCVALVGPRRLLHAVHNRMALGP